MAEPTGRPGTEHGVGQPNGIMKSRTPRWVIVAGLIAAVVVLAVIVLLLVGGHGPGRHAPSGDSGGGVTSQTVTAGGHG